MSASIRRAKGKMTLFGRHSGWGLPAAFAVPTIILLALGKWLWALSLAAIGVLAVLLAAGLREDGIEGEVDEQLDRHPVLAPGSSLRDRLHARAAHRRRRRLLRERLERDAKRGSDPIKSYRLPPT
jgi:hypothetical protein